jgi:transcriptional regulator of acetoin/glycerol metabolism
VDAEAVRAALRDFHKPLELARSPLASGTSPVERAEAVRELLRGAIDQAFGTSADEQLLRSVLERGYLAQDTSLESAALELHLSRATFFRRLKRAVDRVVAVVAR